MQLRIFGIKIYLIISSDYENIKIILYCTFLILLEKAIKELYWEQSKIDGCYGNIKEICENVLIQ